MPALEPQIRIQKSPYESVIDSHQKEMQFREKEREFGQLANREAKWRERFGQQYRHVPGVLAAFSEIGEFIKAEQASESRPLSIAEYFERSTSVANSAETHDRTLADDHSQWSPRLRELIKRLFPEETREERIRTALETPPVVLGEGLTMEEIRYFAEDVDLEYDV